eukprot:6713_1
MPDLVTAFDILAGCWIFCYFIVYVAHTKGKGVCQEKQSEKLSIEEYDIVILVGILRSKTYRYRSKCHGYWYKCYVNILLFSPLKVFISTYLNMYALIEVIPDIEDSNTAFYVSVICGYLLGLGVLFYRIHRLIMHYPFINVNNESFDNKILPYLVKNTQTSALSSCAVEFINTFVGFTVVRQHPSTEITLLVIIAISISLIFAIKNAYTQCKFFFRARNCVYRLDFGYNEQARIRYNDFVRLEKMYWDVLAESRQKCGLQYIMLLFLFVLYMIVCLVAFGIGTVCSYRSYYYIHSKIEMCDVFHSEVWIWVTIVFVLVLPFAPIIAKFGFYLNFKANIAKLIWLIIACLLMIIFGSIYVNETKSNENVEIFVAGIVLIIIGSCWCCVFCCMMCSDWDRQNVERNNENMDVNSILLVENDSNIDSNYQTTNDDQGISSDEMLIALLKQLETDDKSQ